MARSENTCTNLYQARGPRRTLPCVDSMTHPLLRHRRAGCECAARTVEALGDREVERIATRPSHRAV